jgi:hypothetical protein
MAAAHPGIREVVTPGVARAKGFAPTAQVAVPPGVARATGFGPVEVIGPAALVAYAVVTHDG